MLSVQTVLRSHVAAFPENAERGLVEGGLFCFAESSFALVANLYWLCEVLF